MSAVRSRTRARTAAVAAASLVAAGFALVTTAPAAVAAPSTTLVISEVFGGGGGSGAYKQDYVELQNIGTSSANLSGMSLQYRSASGTSSQVKNLAGSVAPNGGKFLVQMSTGGTGADIPTPDYTAGTTISMSGTAGSVFLVSNTTAVTGTVFGNANVVDLLGYAAGAGNYETAAGPGITSSTAASRNAAGTDTDNNANDFTAGTPNPQNSSYVPPSGSVTVNTGGDRTNDVNDPVSGTITASGGVAPYTYSATGLPSGVNLAANGTLSGTATPAGSYTVNVTATDSTSGTALTGSGSFTWQINGPVVPLTIAEIQGTGTASPFATQTKTTEGVVTASYPTGGYQGFYIQTPGPDTANASDAIFVYGGANLTTYPTVGQSVRVTGVVTEFGTAPNTLTEIVVPNNAAVTTIGSLGAVTPKSVVPGTDCALGACPATAAAINALREASEGELFQPSGDYTVTDVYDGSAYNGGVSTSSEYRGEIGLAAESDIPLMSPTEVNDAQTQGITDTTNYNNAHRMILDDASSTSYWNTSNSAAGQNSPLSWLTPTHTVRVGAEVTFPAPVVLEWRNDLWKLQPQSQVIGAPTAGEDPQFAQDRPATPANVGGDLKLATFNVLNYFTTLGASYGGCTSFTDKNSNPIAVNQCPGNGPRGAWNAANFNRQQEKIVNAINTMDADIVSLEEIENSRKVDGVDRDEAVSALVDALNTAAGTTRWDYVASPDEADLPTVAEEDVIRTAFIYDPSTVELVGDSQILVGVAAFNNAREPFAQAFKAAGGDDADGFGVIVNHFKSKGSGANDGTGQGLANPDRVAQANALNTFANDFADDAGVEAVFLTGDFNAYSMEDPVQALEDEDWVNLESTDDPEEKSYSFDGASGSLDHVFANPAADDMVSGVDVWEINSNEPLFYQYSRYNYVTPLLYTSGPFAASDHNPEVIGINVPDAALVDTTTTVDDASSDEGTDATIHVAVDPLTDLGDPTGTVTLSIGGNDVGSGPLSGGEADIVADTSGLADGTYTVTATYEGDSVYNGSSDTATLTVNVDLAEIQLFGTNDFHGRIQNDAASAAAGAAAMATAIKQARTANPNTVFAAAGDLIGASTFESFIAKDKPTLDALKEAGLEVSAVGNHEFDAGYNDLVNRVMQPYNASTNPYGPAGGIGWQYLGANVKFKATGNPALPAVWTKTMDGVEVGFIGAVTEHLDELVSPAGIADIEATDIVAATNTEANALKTAGADIIVLLVHEGAAGSSCATMDDDPTSDFGKIIAGVNDKVDAIVSGHTHLEYNCSFPVAGWSGRPVTERPVVSAGQYGAALNKIVFTVDKADGAIQDLDQSVVRLKTCTPVAPQTSCGTAPATPWTNNFAQDGPTAAIVSAAVSESNTLGAVEVGRVAQPFKRAYFSGGTVENRGGESTLGNLVAEVQRWATRNPESGSAQIAFMNPGGLRTDILGTADASPGLKVTFKDAANVQPFANTLVNMDLTGAQIRAALEQQWQPGGSSRPFLKLGISKGFTYTYDPSAASGSRIKQMRLNGTLIGNGDVFSVTVNSFLASGGDNFAAFNGGTGKQDTGKIDLQSMVDYMAAFAASTPLAVDYSQRSVGVKFPAAAPAAYSPGDTVAFDVSSFSMTNTSDTKDGAVTVVVDGNPVQSATLDNAPQSGNSTNGADEVGKASVSFTMPNLPPGTTQVELVGLTTGTSVKVPVTVAKARTTLVGNDLTVAVNKTAKLVVAVSGPMGLPTGTVEFYEGATLLGSSPVGPAGNAKLDLPAGTLDVGPHSVRAVYGGDAAYLSGGEDTFDVTITKATSIVTAPTTITKQKGKPIPVPVTIATSPAWPVSGTITISENGSPLITTAVTGKTTVVTVPGGLAAGPHNLDVSYSGDAEVSQGTANTTVNVTKAASKIVVAATPNRPRVGQPATVNITVTGGGAAASGDVDVTVDGGAVQTLPLNASGMATLPIGPFGTAGPVDIVVTYGGSSDLNGSTTTRTITVRP